MALPVWHTCFEILGWLAAIGVSVGTRRRFFAEASLPLSASQYPAYMIILWVGAVGGAFALGTLNLQLAAQAAAGRSILGAMLGGILAAESYKTLHGIRGSTGSVFVLPLAVAIAVGRIGCFLGGLDDYTYGTPTALPWGVDSGDGIGRHPVQLYESGTMAAVALAFLGLLKRRPDVAVQRGFYLFAAVYGIQRFLWEFLKPYPAVIGSLNVFHLGAAVLTVYALIMLARLEKPYARS